MTREGFQLIIGDWLTLGDLDLTDRIDRVEAWAIVEGPLWPAEAETLQLMQDSLEARKASAREIAKAETPEDDFIG